MRQLDRATQQLIMLMRGKVVVDIAAGVVEDVVGHLKQEAIMPLAVDVVVEEALLLLLVPPVLLHRHHPLGQPNRQHQVKQPGKTGRNSTCSLFSNELDKS